MKAQTSGASKRYSLYLIELPNIGFFFLAPAQNVADEVANLTTDELMQRIRMHEQNIKIMKSEANRVNHEIRNS